MKKKVCVVTGTRAEYGLLKPLIQKIQREKELELMLYVTGTHLSPDFGYTVQEIEQDQIPIKRRIEMLLSADSSSAVLKSMSVELMGFADALGEDRPDMMVVLGDRYEILMAATAAMIFRIPIAHIHGGELTEGLIDEAVRHAVTKMSLFHFVTTEQYRRRVIQLGENPERVFTVGALGVESIKALKLLGKEELESSMGMQLEGQVALVTFHPVTLANEDGKKQIGNLLKALERFPNMHFVITKANADMEGRKINELLEEFVAQNQHCALFSSLGQLRYLSLLQFCDVVIGNSSSGLIEVPSFHIPTVNIGDRQKRRVRAESVIDCKNREEDIVQAIELGLSEPFQEKLKTMSNPYEKENTSGEILNILKEKLEEGTDIQKHFYDMG